MKIPPACRWKSIQTLGSGGQATVLKVEDRTGALPGVFALKGISPDKPPKAYSRFLKEIQALHQITHPAVIKIVDSYAAKGEFSYYVMEYIEGVRPLRKIISDRESPFYKNPLACLDLARQLIEAVQYWSTLGIVHRDLSPNNILVTPENKTKVIDFGICQIDETETLTLCDEGVGTINYMAPECESGASQPITAKADLYSVGKIVWSCITGQLAFARENPAFNSKAMYRVFPEDPSTFHLHPFFEFTIRHSSDDRLDCAELLNALNRIAYVIPRGFVPIELVGHVCPYCGIGPLKNAEGLHNIFGNPNPGLYKSLACVYCGFACVIDFAKQKYELGKRAKMT